MPKSQGLESPESGSGITRRGFVHLTGVAAAAAVFGGLPRFDEIERTAPASVAAQATAAREFAVAAAPLTLDLAGTTVNTWGYNGTVPGPLIRITAGDTTRVRFQNSLAKPSTIHWHGIALQNDMDGVPGVTQDAVPPGGQFTYEFVPPDPGTYFLHSHVGMQLDRGLYAPLIVDDPNDPGGYDAEWVVVLDDWVDGTGETPDQVLRRLEDSMDMGHSSMSKDGSGMGSMAMAGSSKLLGGDAGDVRYPFYLANGRPPADPEVFDAKPGQRLRVRIINAGSDTAFRVALGEHRLTVTHADGFAVTATDADAVLLGMGERVDAIVTLADGVFPLVAVAEGKRAQAVAVVRTGAGTSGGPKVHPRELDGQVVLAAHLEPASGVAIAEREPDRTHRLVLAGGQMGYRWTINGKTYDPERSLRAVWGERVRLVFDNRSTMFHPMHLHGHTFSVMSRRGSRFIPGPRKDTVIVRPAERIVIDFDAHNAGDWVVHCHNAYHQATGMMTTIAYAK